MKKILTTLIASLLLSVFFLKAEERVLMVKPRATVTIDTETSWGGINAVNEEKYIMQKVEGEDNLYMCSITVDKYFKTSKWKTSYGQEYEDNEGWSDIYQYFVVFQDNYDETEAVANNDHPKQFTVDADGTTVTFYARLVQDGDYKNASEAQSYAGKIRSFCDAQTSQIYIWENAQPVVWMSAGIGEEMANQEIYIDNISTKKREISLLSLEYTDKRREWADFLSETGEFKNGIYTRGRHMLNLDYKTISYVVYKILDETDNPKLKIGSDDYQDAGNFTGDLGEFGDGTPLLLAGSVDGKTVEDAGTKINTETVSAYLCYEITSDVQTNNEVNRITLTTQAAQTDHATWIGEPTNITDGLSEGEYSIKVWYELITGVDTLRNDNDGNGYVATFSVSNEPISPFLNLEMYVDGGFETLCLPFTVTEMKDSEGASVSPAQLLEYTANEGEIVYFSEANTIQANTPYLIALPKEEGANKKQITFLGTTAETVNPVVNRGNYSFRGTYTTYEETTDPDYYVLNGTGDSFVKAIEETFVPANRAYFKAINPANHSTLRVDTDGTTNVKLISDEVNGIIIYSIGNGIKIIADRAAQINLYTIDGRLVRKTDIVQGENSIEGLLKGIYIVNNQKVVVK